MRLAHYAACLRHRPRLDAYVDGELAARATARVERHLRSCPGCRERVEWARAFAAQVGGTAPPAPGWEGFWPGIEARLRAVQGGAAGRPDRRWRDPWWLPLWKPVWGHPRLAAATASLLLVGGLGLWARPDPERLAAGLAGQVIVQDVVAGRPDTPVMVYTGGHEPATVIWVFAQDTDSPGPR